MNRTAIRFASVALFAGIAATSAHADLTLPTNALVANSVQTFTAEDLGSFDLVNLTVEGRGTTYVAQAGTPGESNGTVTPVAFGFPITKVVIGANLKVVSGTASGSALFFNRTDLDTGHTTGLTLANFTIDYKKNKVLADTTVKGSGVTTPMMPIYDFTVVSPLALKYKFPFSFSLQEQLGSLKLTSEAKAVMTSGLELPDIAVGALDFDYGTLDQTIAIKLRSPAINPKPYVAN